MTVCRDRNLSNENHSDIHTCIHRQSKRVGPFLRSADWNAKAISPNNLLQKHIQNTYTRILKCSLLFPYGVSILVWWRTQHRPPTKCYKNTHKHPYTHILKCSLFPHGVSTVVWWRKQSRPPKSSEIIYPTLSTAPGPTDYRNVGLMSIRVSSPSTLVYGHYSYIVFSYLYSI